METAASPMATGACTIRHGLSLPPVHDHKMLVTHRDRVTLLVHDSDTDGACSIVS